ncbi:MAG: hypothetical protein ACHQ2Z_04970 [Elusimicrobiota bacterium]
MKKLLALLIVSALPSLVRSAGFDASMNFSDVIDQAPPAPATPASAPQGSLPQDRTAELIRQASDWQARKDDAIDALYTLISNVEKPANAVQWHLVGISIRDLAQGIEDQQDILYARASARVRAEEADPKALAGRLSALEVERDFRKFAVYANMVPRIIDEAVRGDDGAGYVGRRFAGPRWKIVLTWDEVAAVNRTVVPKTGFSFDDWEAMGSAVAKEYNAQHPMPPEVGRPD